jgi:outer membrane lipoprotein carrier protein
MLLTTPAFFAIVQMMGPLATPTSLAATPSTVATPSMPAPTTTPPTIQLAQAAPAPPAAAAAPPAAPPTAAPDAALDAVIDTIQKTYEGTTDFRGRFTQKFTYTMLRRTQESSGIVTFQKPGRMRWDYDKPQAKNFIVDGKALWIVQPEDKVAFVNACFQQDGLTASVAFLWGEGKLREQFNISWFDGVFGEKTDHHLLLLPKDNNSVFARLILVVDPKTSRVKQSVVVDPTGNVNQFLFSELKFNVGKAGGVAPATFQYTPTGNMNAQRLPGSCDAPVKGVK